MNTIKFSFFCHLLFCLKDFKHTFGSIMLIKYEYMNMPFNDNFFCCLNNILCFQAKHVDISVIRVYCECL